ncbi:MAG: hypothetical protein RR138_06155 [Akkermansia sp.]
MRQIILMIAVLLIAVGKMNVVSFCDCESGFFIKDCICEQGHEHQMIADAEHHQDIPHDSSTWEHHCHHHTLDSGEVSLAAMSVSVPTFDSSVLMVPPDFMSRDFVLNLLPLLPEIYSPPDRIRIVVVGGLGYCRPLLI